MVQWKGNIDREDSGEKAARLDSIEEFQVPNFFVITKPEIKSLVKEEKTKEAILNTELPGELESRIENAFSDISMSSEVRNASGRARSLVGEDKAFTV